MFSAGDPVDHAYLLLTGHVSLQVTTENGDRAVVAVLGAGELFGELDLREGRRHTTTAVTLDEVQVLTVSRARFLHLRQSHPPVDAFLVDVLADQVRRQQARLLEVLCVPAPRRVLRRVVAMAHLYGAGATTVVIPLTQEVWAGMAGTTRPTANQVLREAERAGLIRMQRGQVCVLDLAGLARRARQPPHLV